jgi:hypothetical protein
MNFAQLLSVFLLLTRCSCRSDENHEIRIINDSGSSLKLFWIDQTNNNQRHHLVDATDLAKPGSQLSLNSFAGHVFEVHESPDPSTGVCAATDSGDQLCRVASFTVRDDVLDEQSK